MIAIIRSASIAPGKMGNATAFGHQIAKSIKTKHGTTLEVLMPIGGNPGRIAWLARYDSVARWEALTGKLIADKEYMNLILKQAETFLPGSVHDDIWRAI
jgi:hypothetical protein